MNTSRRSLLKAMGAVSALALPFRSLSASAADVITIKLSHVVAEQTPKGLASLKFKELAEKAFPGRVVVEVYPNSQLYKDNEEVEALQLGSVQLLAPSLAKFGPLGVHEFEVFDLPYIFADDAAFKAVTLGSVGADLFKKLEPKGVKGLAYWDNGFEHMSANKPLHLPTDCQGLKMRIQSSKVLDAEMRALGALPQVMAFSELYQALQTSVVDGTEGTPSNYFTQKFFEVQKHMTLTSHNHLSYALIANKQFWEGLPADVRPVLDQAVKDATEFGNSLAKKKNDDALAAIAASGKCTVYTPTADEKAAWVKALVPVHKEMASRIGQDTVDAVYKATGFKA